MVKEGIKIFSRVKPTKKECGVSIPYVRVSLCWAFDNISQSFELGENSEGLETLSFHVPRSESSGYVNNKQEIYAFQWVIGDIVPIHMYGTRAGLHMYLIKVQRKRKCLIL